MPPIRTQVVTRSKKEREQIFISPSRGRGRRRRTQRHHAHQTTPATAISNVAGIGTSTMEMDPHCLTEDFAGQPSISPEPVPDSEYDDADSDLFDETSEHSDPVDSHAVVLDDTSEHSDPVDSHAEVFDDMKNFIRNMDT